jgi:hypothetical protein
MNTTIHRLRETRLGDTVLRSFRNRLSGPGWGGFHRDLVYRALILDLLQTFDFSSFVETGTDRGYSTEFVASRFPKLPVITVEVLESTFRRTKRFLDGYPNVKMMRGSSDDVLMRLLDDRTLGPRPIFYLDAHWQTHWPLEKELRSIGEAGLPSAIVIDDFEVPGQPQFGYDTYGAGDEPAGTACNLEYVERALLPGRDYRAAFPRYGSSDAFPDDAGVLRGHVVIFQEMPDQYEAFLRQSVIQRHYFGHGRLASRR